MDYSEMIQNDDYGDNNEWQKTIHCVDTVVKENTKGILLIITCALIYSSTKNYNDIDNNHNAKENVYEAEDTL